MATRSYGAAQGHWQCYLDVTQANTATAATIQMACGFHSTGWGFALTGVQIAVGYTTSRGGSGGPWAAKSDVSVANGATADVQMASNSWSWPRGHAGYVANVWAQVDNVTGYEDGTSHAEQNVYVPPLDSWTVSYDAAGGSGAPSSQVKWYGEALTLSSAKPRRAGYAFAGWAGSDGKSYAAGATYSGNSALRLTAKWTSTHRAPTVSGVTAWRSGSSGAADDDGTYGTARVRWSCDGAGKAVEALLYDSTSKAWKVAKSVAVSEASGTTDVTFGGSLAVTDRVAFRVRVTDAAGASTTASGLSVPPKAYVMRLAKGGTGVSFGVPVSMDRPLAVASGGTGATEGRQALRNLGMYLYNVSEMWGFIQSSTSPRIAWLTGKSSGSNQERYELQCLEDAVQLRHMDTSGAWTTPWYLPKSLFSPDAGTVTTESVGSNGTLAASRNPRVYGHIVFAWMALTYSGAIYSGDSFKITGFKVNGYAPVAMLAVSDCFVGQGSNGTVLCRQLVNEAAGSSTNVLFVCCMA